VTIDALEVAQRIASCSEVARLTGGLGGVGTPVIGDRWVEGVRDLDPGIEVHVVARWDFTIERLTAQIHDRIGSLGSPIEVIIDDVATPYDEMVVSETVIAVDNDGGPDATPLSG